MKYTITIEETVAKNFEIEAISANEAYEMLNLIYASKLMMHLSIAVRAYITTVTMRSAVETFIAAY